MAIFFLFLKSVNLTHTTLCFVLHGKTNTFLPVTSNSWCFTSLVRRFPSGNFLPYSHKDPGLNGGRVSDKIVFLLSKGQKLSPCFSCWFLSDSSSCRKQIAYFLSHFLSQKNGLYWILFLSLPFSTTFCLGAFYKLQWDVLLPISSFRCFRLLSSSKKWGMCFSMDVSQRTIAESSDSHLRVTLPRRHLSLSGDIFVCHNWGLWLLLDFMSRGQECSKPPTMHRTGPHNKESSGPHASSTEAEKPCHRDMLTSLMYFFFLHFYPWSQFSLSHLIQPPSLSPIDLTTPSPSYHEVFFHSLYLLPSHCLMILQSS